MNWKVKAFMQNAIDLLPSSLSYEVYYKIQRNFGGLKDSNRINGNPISRLQAGIEIWEKIQQSGRDPRDKVFFEVGTGRVPTMPLSFFLMGAKNTVTVDLNPYVKEEMVLSYLNYMAKNPDVIRELFGPLLDEQRFEQLLNRITDPHFSIKKDFYDLCRIEYHAPSDASDTKLPRDIIDFHVSYTVYEHIPGEILSNIIKEGNRICRKDALFVNFIDYSDHFAQMDKSISLINFLQYSDNQWKKYAGNKFMYMNRLRHDDYLAILSAANHEIVDEEVIVDERSKEILENGLLDLDEKFRHKSLDTLSIISSWLISRQA